VLDGLRAFNFASSHHLTRHSRDFGTTLTGCTRPITLISSLFSQSSWTVPCGHRHGSRQCRLTPHPAHGADVNAKSTSDGNNALHELVLGEETDFDEKLAVLLALPQLDLTAVNSAGLTAAAIARQKGKEAAALQIEAKVKPAHSLPRAFGCQSCPVVKQDSCILHDA
jgi:hypothetical protein